MEYRKYVVIITGRPASGKSTLVRKLAGRLKEMNFRVAGVITPEIREKDKAIKYLESESIENLLTEGKIKEINKEESADVNTISEEKRSRRYGFFVFGISSGEKDLLALDKKIAKMKKKKGENKGENKGERIGENKGEITCDLGKYIVFPERFSYVLKKELEAVKDHDIFLIDEVGPMELGCSSSLNAEWLKTLKEKLRENKILPIITVKKNISEKLIDKMREENKKIEFIDIDIEGREIAYLRALEIATGGTEAFLFDLDGVIVDSAKFHMLSWIKLMREKGINFGEDDFKRTFGMTNDLILRKYFPNASPEDIKKMGEQKERIYRELAKGKIKPIDGSIEFIRELKENRFKIALVSSTPIENILFLSKELGLSGLFDAIVSGSEIKRGKPDPECYILGSEKINIPPQRCWVVEDSQHGIDAARRAGAKTIGILTTHKDLENTDLKVRNFQELRDIMSKILKFN